MPISAAGYTDLRLETYWVGPTHTIICPILWKSKIIKHNIWFCVASMSDKLRSNEMDQWNRPHSILGLLNEERENFVIFCSITLRSEYWQN